MTAAPASRMMSTSCVATAWTVGAELGAPDVAIDGSELAAYRLARMSSRLVQHLPGAGVDPMSVWHTLAAWCPVDFVIGRTLAALGRTPQLQGAGDRCAGDPRGPGVRGDRLVVHADAEARVQRARAAGRGCDEVSFDVVVTRGPGGAMGHSVRARRAAARAAASDGLGGPWRGDHMRRGVGMPSRPRAWAIAFVVGGDEQEAGLQEVALARLDRAGGVEGVEGLGQVEQVGAEEEGRSCWAAWWSRRRAGGRGRGRGRARSGRRGRRGRRGGRRRGRRGRGSCRPRRTW
jgi:hypothetical protein